MKIETENFRMLKKDIQRYIKIIGGVPDFIAMHDEVQLFDKWRIQDRINSRR
jgi:hypothetical protein